jgi:hypothetical protein
MFLNVLSSMMVSRPILVGVDDANTEVHNKN